MTNEPEMIGVDVWAAVTIYVPARDDDEAAAIVAERYAGSRDKIGSYDHMGSEDLPMEDDDFMSSAMTFYGLCNDSELHAAVDPVRDAAPDMLEALKAVLSDAYEDDEGDWLLYRMSDGDGEPIGEPSAIKKVREAIAKAEGRL